MTKLDPHDPAELDCLVKQALRQEYARVDAPPPEKVWARIRNGLAESPAMPPAIRSLRLLPWTRLAVVVAAVLVIVIGGLSQTWPRFAFRYGSQESKPADRVTVSEEAIQYSLNDALSGSDPEDSGMESGGLPQDYHSGETWPSVIGQTYLLRGINTGLDEGRLTGTDHVVYIDPESGSKLLYISLGPESMDRERLLEELFRITGMPVTIGEKDAPVTFLAENGTLGLGWVSGERMMLLVAPDGDLTMEQLQEIRLTLP